VTIDLCRLNQVTCRQSFAMPQVSESLDFLSQSTYISVLDCTQSYFHIPLKQSDREKTAFLTRKGLFQWCVLPQGATNAPAIFSRLMSLVLHGLNYLCVLSFIDDIVVIGRTFEDSRNGNCVASADSCIWQFGSRVEAFQSTVEQLRYCCQTRSRGESVPSCYITTVCWCRCL